jgi:drug/metabolite transporter (DMT)-like permease
MLAWLFLSLVWGSTWLFIKLGLEDLPPFSFASLRFSIALVPLVVILLWRRLPLPRRRIEWGLMAISGVLVFSIDYGLIFWGERHLTSGMTAVLFCTVPLFGLFFAHLMLPAERLRSTKVLGVLLGIAGVAVLFAHQLRQEDPLAPVASVAIVVAAASAALSNTMVKAYLTHLDPLVVTTGQMAVGVVPLLALGALLEAGRTSFEWTPLAVVSLIYLALVGSTVGFLVFYRLVRVLEVTKVQLIILVNPLVAVALGWLVLGETLGARELLGAVGVLVGLALTLSTHPSEARRRRARSQGP